MNATPRINARKLKKKKKIKRLFYRDCLIIVNVFLKSLNLLIEFMGVKKKWATLSFNVKSKTSSVQFHFFSPQSAF